MSLNTDTPIIYLITTGEATTENFDRTSRKILEIIGIAVEAGVSIIQLREKHLSAQLLFELAVDAAKITRRTSTRLLVNDRADIALAAKADGVHLAANSLPVKVIRENCPSDFIIGASTHTLEAARSAAGNGADFVVFGPVFETPGKGDPQGVERLAEICGDLHPFPVVGLGGINQSNYSTVLEAGASGFAGIRFLNDPEQLQIVCRDLRK